MRSLSARAAALLVLLVSLGVSAGETEEAEAGVDWSQYAGEETVTAVTANDDGTERETTIWIVVIGGDAYIRTGNTRWGGNLEKRPDISLRIAAEEIPVRVDFIADEDLRGRVKAAFRSKYGFMDRLIDVFRGGTPKIMRVAERGEP
jgi:hypothetical protein